LEISVLPNPSTQKFVLEIKSNSKMTIQFTLTDVYGRRMYSATGLPGKSYTFGETLLPGIYTIKLIQGEASTTYKIIKE